MLSRNNTIKRVPLQKYSGIDIHQLSNKEKYLTQLTTVACAGVGLKPAANSSDCKGVSILKGKMITEIEVLLKEEPVMNK